MSHKRKDYHSDGFAWTRKTFRQLEVAQWCDRVKSYGWVYHYEWQHLIHYWYQNIYYSSSKGFICTRQTNSPNCARQANEQKVKEYRIQLSTAARVCISRRLHPQGWKNSLQRRDGRALVLDRREKQRQTHTHTQFLCGPVKCAAKSQAVKQCLLCSLYLEDHRSWSTLPHILPPSQIQLSTVFSLRYEMARTCPDRRIVLQKKSLSQNINCELMSIKKQMFQEDFYLFIQCNVMSM